MPLFRAQIILSALIVGVIALTVAAIFAHPKIGSTDAELGQKLLLILAGLPVLALPAYALMRRRATRLLARRHHDARAEARNHQIPPELLGAVIVGASLAEGLGLFGATIFLITGQWLALVAPALAIIVIGIPPIDPEFGGPGGSLRRRPGLAPPDFGVLRKG